MKRLLALAVCVAACGSDTVPPGDVPVDEPVYYGQVQRIINDNCVECHSADPDRLAPFALVTYEDSVAAATDLPMAYDLMNRIMPPFYADQDNCNTFSNAHWLSGEDLDTLTTWINGSKLAGDPANTVAPPPPPGGLISKDRTLDIGMDYLPNTAVADDFRCFVVPALAVDQFLTGVHVKPSNLTVAHHVILFALDSSAAEADVVAKSASGPYECPGGPTQLGATFLAGWIPGNQATRFPANTGIPIDGSRKMVIQVHYNLANSDSKPDHTTIDLDLEPAVDTPAQIVQMRAPVNLQPLQEDAVTTGTLSIPGPASSTSRIWGSVMHMHQRGTHAKLSLANREQCVLDLVNWSFHWQHFYWLDQPIEVHGGDKIQIECGYDTTGDTIPVTFCEGTDCEMCIAFSYVTN
ncbi:MAG: hypothetical protein ABI867_19650 [Kofleriaceae bacterium]